MQSGCGNEKTYWRLIVWQLLLLKKKTLENIHFVDNIKEKEVEKNEYRGKGEFCDSSSTTNQKSKNHWSSKFPKVKNERKSSLYHYLKSLIVYAPLRGTFCSHDHISCVCFFWFVSLFDFFLVKNDCLLNENIYWLFLHDFPYFCQSRLFSGSFKKERKYDGSHLITVELLH